MNVCFAIGTLNYSGAEKIMYYLIKQFVELGNNVSVILLSSDRKFDGLDGVTQYPIYSVQEEKEGRVLRSLKRQSSIRKIIHENDFDVIVSFGSMFNVDIAEACFFEKIKIILCERNDPINDPKTKFKRLRRSISYKRGNGFVFQTETIKEFFNKSIQRKSTVIPNFIDKTIDIENGYLPRRNVIATSCRIDNYQKDLSTLIKSFADFYNTHEEYILEFYGDGPDKALIEKLADELSVGHAVKFLGRVSDPMSYIRECKLFVLSSNYEGMPNALIEAMAYGMPCVASNCSGGGPKALIEHGNNGFIFEIGDVSHLSALMSEICDNPEIAKRIGRKAYEINDTLNIKKIVGMWINYVNNVVGK